MRPDGTMQVALSFEPTLRGHTDPCSTELQNTAGHNSESCRSNMIGASYKARVSIRPATEDDGTHAALLSCRVGDARHLCDLGELGLSPYLLLQQAQNRHAGTSRGSSVQGKPGAGVTAQSGGRSRRLVESLLERPTRTLRSDTPQVSDKCGREELALSAAPQTVPRASRRGHR